MTNKFRKDLGIATVSSFISFTISLLFTPLMTRWYQPDDYGFFAVVNNLATFLVSLFLMSLPNVLPVVHTWRDRSRLLRTLIALSMGAFTVSVIGTMLFLIDTYVRGGIVHSEWLFAFLPFLVLVIALHRIAQSWANADGAFTSMAMARVVHPLFSKPLAIAASMLSGANPAYMIFFEGVAYIVQVATMLHGRFVKLKGIFPKPNKKNAVLVLAYISKYKDYTLFLNFVNLLSLGLVTLQTVILTVAYSSTETGYFTLAVSTVSLPIQLISMSTASVIYHRLIVCGHEEPHALSKMIYKLLLAFMLLGVLPYLSIFYYGDGLFSFAFGEEWRTSGEIASILALPMYLTFLYTPIASIFRVTSSIKLQFKVDLFFVLATIVIFYLATQEFAFAKAVTLLASVVSVHQFVGIGFCLYVVSNSKTQTPDLVTVK